MKKMVILAAALMMIFPACVRAEDMMSSVTVQGTGSVTVTPDLGTIAFAVTEEGPEAEDVQKAITEKANTVSTALSEAGLPEDHFQTAGIRLYADYDYSSEVEILVGYRGQISMSVEEISVDEVGKYLQILSENGVNQIDGITVFYSGYEDAYREALEKAMLQARGKAQTLAGAENAKITGRFSVEEGWQNDSLRGREKTLESNMVMTAAGDAASQSLDYSVGTTEVEATVKVCYEIETKSA